jgi:hypothetical protein
MTWFVDSYNYFLKLPKAYQYKVKEIRGRLDTDLFGGKGKRGCMNIHMFSWEGNKKLRRNERKKKEKAL